jgi:hypothetical protein
MATTPVVAEPQGNSSVNGFSRIIGVVINPKETFGDIAKRPTWLLPIVLIVLVSLAITYIYGARVGWRSLIEKQIDSSSRTSQMTTDQKEKAIDQGAKIAPIIGYGSAVVAIPLVAVIIAGILLGVFSLIASARIEFRTALGIVSHSWVPGLIGGLLGLIVVSVKAPDLIDIENLVATNVGAFLSSDSPHWLLKLGSSLDLFTFWTIFLMALGFSAANPKKVSVGKALAIIGGMWVLVVLVKVGWAAAFS